MFPCSRRGFPALENHRTQDRFPLRSRTRCAASWKSSRCPSPSCPWGFRVDSTPEERHQFQLMAMVLGGVPSSKLFQNVREKMSLCYYCSSGLVGNSRSMFIESGVETSNLEKAEEAIYGQLSALQKGELTEEELLSAKLAYCNSLRSINDSLPAMESAYLGQVFSGLVLPQEESIAGLCPVPKNRWWRRQTGWSPARYSR